MSGDVIRSESGSFLRMYVLPVITNGGGVSICFPAGQDGSGWQRAAEALGSFVGELGLPDSG